MDRFWDVINRILILRYDPRLPRVIFISATLLVVAVSPLILVKLLVPDLPEAGEFIVQDTEFGTEEPQKIRIEDFVPAIETLVSNVIPTTQPSNEGDAGTPASESDSSSTYLHGIVHLPGSRSMIRFVLTEGVSGTYEAIISDESDLKYQCFIPDGYNDRLYCYGPMLTNGRLATIKLFRIGDDSTEEEVVYEETILISISTTLPIPYGGGFAWPDRFNDAEEQRKLTRLEWLYPLSISTTAFCVVGVLIAFYLRKRSQPSQLRRVPSHESSTLINGRQTLTRGDELLRGINRVRVHITAATIFCITGIIYILTLSRTINSFSWLSTLPNNRKCHFPHTHRNGALKSECFFRIGRIVSRGVYILCRDEIIQRSLEFSAGSINCGIFTIGLVPSCSGRSLLPESTLDSMCLSCSTALE